MTALRFLALAVLSLWTGGLAALGLAAPRLFSVLEAGSPTAGRALGGRAFGAIFTDFQHVAWALGLLLLLSLVLRAALGPRPRRFARRMWTAAAMLLGSLATALVIAPRIAAIEARTPGAVAALAADDPDRVTFERLHATANGIVALTVIAGFGLIWTEMRDAN